MPSFKVDEYISLLKETEGFLGNPDIDLELSWQSSREGNILVKSRGEDAAEAAILTIVGRVSHSARTFLGPLGNYNPDYKIDKTKWIFSIQRPEDPQLAEAYDIAVGHITKFLETISTSKKIENLLISVGSAIDVRMTGSVFKTKIYDEDTEETPTGNISNRVGDYNYFPTWKNWPIPSDLRKKVDAVKGNLIFTPLNVFLYETERRVDPAKLATLLPGALVEIQFGLHHWSFTNHDSCNAIVTSVLLLREAIPIKKDSPASLTYSRKGGSPVKANPFQKASKSLSKDPQTPSEPDGQEEGASPSKRPRSTTPGSPSPPSKAKKRAEIDSPQKAAAQGSSTDA